MIKYKPVTSSQRHCCIVNKKCLGIYFFFKSLIRKKYSSYGKSRGRISCFHRWRGHKKLYRNVSHFSLTQCNIPFKIKTVEYDPNRSSFISLVYYMNGIYSYICTNNSHIIDNVYVCSLYPFIYTSYGNRNMLINIPVGTIISFISGSFNGSIKYSRSAGTYGFLLRKSFKFAIVGLPSGDTVQVSNKAFGSLGRASNRNHVFEQLGKAGRSFWKGMRPVVRGVAMNPVDHPHGGGEGKKSKPASPRNPWSTVLKNSRKFKRRKS